MKTAHEKLVYDFNGDEFVSFKNYLTLVQVNTNQERQINALRMSLREAKNFICDSFCESKKIHCSMCNEMSSVLDGRKLK